VAKALDLSVLQALAVTGPQHGFGLAALVAPLAHELQHALEVAQAPEARDAESVEKLFDRSAMPFGCSSTTCYETPASKDVEDAVRNELKITARQSKSQRYVAASTSEGH
jgi:hypothetical protein